MTLALRASGAASLLAALASTGAAAQSASAESARWALPPLFATVSRMVHDAEPRVAGVRPIAVAKWTTVAGAAAAAAYGFIRNAEADDLFGELERACQASPIVCAQRAPDGAYADPALEAMYQDVLARDRASRYALVGSQLGIAAGVVLFLLDLRSDARPQDIPYDPKRFEVGPAAGGGLQLTAHIAVGF